MPDTHDTPSPVVSITDLTFAWGAGELVLDIPSLHVAAGERLFLRGPSGSGKSTLLGLIAGILSPRSGQVRVLDRDLTTLGGMARDAWRAQHLGLIFQMFNLVPFLSILDNVLLPCRFSAEREKQAGGFGAARVEAHRLLTRLGLEGPTSEGRSVAELSVGQQQRVAAARALIGGPSLIIADEPTSALDTGTRDDFLRLLIEECTGHDTALLFVSHDASLAARFDREIDLAILNRATTDGVSP